MKNIAIVAAALAAVAASPAFAGTFTGPRIEATAGYNDVTNVPSNRDFAYGVEAGYDLGLTKKITVGVEAGADNVLDRRDINVGARLGYALNDHALVHVNVGYDNFRNLQAHTLDGLRLGAGVDLNVAGPVYLLADYRHTDFGGVKKNAVVGGVGFRF
jgi:outer membrane immunogenic protein